MFKLHVLGIAESALSSEQEQILANCQLIVGTKRLTGLAAHLPCRSIEITPLATAFAAIRSALPQGNVAVLARGDPPFYGIGRRLLAEFPQGIIQIYPAISSIQRACALFKITWDDARIISLHGRKCDHVPGLLLNHNKILALTDGVNSPDKIAGLLLDYLQLIGETDLAGNIKVLVAEDLGLENEKIFSGTLRQAYRQTFSPLNILCLLAPNSLDDTPFRFGLTENLLQHSRGLITKNEVRAATLHQLQLPAKGVFWDVGAGSGSLSIEAARSNPELTVYAIEHKEEELENIKNNIVKFRCYNIVPVFGRAPEALAGLPDPDRVFIGGSGGALAGIIGLAAERLATGGSLVVNGVIEKTIRMAPDLMTQHGLTVTSAVLQISRTEPNGNVRDFNPITIMTGRR